MSGLTEDQRAFLDRMRWQTNGRTSQARTSAEAFSGDPEQHNAILLALYESDYVFPDSRGWWALTAKGHNETAIPLTTREGAPRP